MKEIEFLKSMWAPKIKRQIELIVAEITYSNNIGSLNNDHWEYIVPYAFREALDIKYEQRTKDKKQYMIWTQGPILRFKEGDYLKSKNGTSAVQVLNANSMGWDTSINQMYEGNVVFDEFEVQGNDRIKIRRSDCTQMQFLEMLIYGV